MDDNILELLDEIMAGGPDCVIRQARKPHLPILIKFLGDFNIYDSNTLTKYDVYMLIGVIANPNLTIKLNNVIFLTNKEYRAFLSSYKILLTRMAQSPTDYWWD